MKAVNFPVFPVTLFIQGCRIEMGNLEQHGMKVELLNSKGGIRTGKVWKWLALLDRRRSSLCASIMLIIEA